MFTFGKLTELYSRISSLSVDLLRHLIPEETVEIIDTQIVGELGLTVHGTCLGKKKKTVMVSGGFDQSA